MFRSDLEQIFLIGRRCVSLFLWIEETCDREMRDDYGSRQKDRRDRETKGWIQEKEEWVKSDNHSRHPQNLLTTTVYEKCENMTPRDLFWIEHLGFLLSTKKWLNSQDSQEYSAKPDYRFLRNENVGFWFSGITVNGFSSHVIHKENRCDSPGIRSNQEVMKTEIGAIHQPSKRKSVQQENESRVVSFWISSFLMGSWTFSLNEPSLKKEKTETGRFNSFFLFKCNLHQWFRKKMERPQFKVVMDGQLDQIVQCITQTNVPKKYDWLREQIDGNLNKVFLSFFNSLISSIFYSLFERAVVKFRNVRKNFISVRRRIAFFVEREIENLTRGQWKNIRGLSMEWQGIHFKVWTTWKNIQHDSDSMIEKAGMLCKRA